MQEFFSRDSKNLLVKVFKLDELKSRYNFLTDEEEPLQVGVMNITKNTGTDLHKHKKIRKEVCSTLESWLVLDGRVSVEVLDDKQNFIAKIVLTTGDLMLTYGGFHSLTSMDSCSKVLETRNGPYLGRENEIVSL